MRMVMDSAQTVVATCLAAKKENANAALKSVQQCNIVAAGSNLSGIETSIHEGVQYNTYSFSDLLIDALKRLNGAENILKNTLEVVSRRISKTSFKMAKTLRLFSDTFEFAFTQIAEMANDFKGMNEFVENELLKSIDEHIYQESGSTSFWDAFGSSNENSFCN